eukprot:4212134-Pyramimonas_sp.AAC.1
MCNHPRPRRLGLTMFPLRGTIGVAARGGQECRTTSTVRDRGGQVSRSLSTAGSGAREHPRSFVLRAPMAVAVDAGKREGAGSSAGCDRPNGGGGDQPAAGVLPGGRGPAADIPRSGGEPSPDIKLRRLRRDPRSRQRRGDPDAGGSQTCGRRSGASGSDD